MDRITQQRIRQAYDTAREALLAERSADGTWEGRLSASALATATAVSAFAVVGSAVDAKRMQEGLAWLALDQNQDGGWGDTPQSPSNVPTTLLVRAAFGLAHAETQFVAIIDAGEAYLTQRAGADGPARAAAVKKLYGADRTFAVPILANCALAGHVDWADIPALPFELACVPRWTWRSLGLQVVSYALPALIAIGALLHEKHATRNPLRRWLRNHTQTRALGLLADMQPADGGFLEAIPLTAFVAMSLAAIGLDQCGVVRDALRFLRQRVREDGSWPIDTDLALWLTTGAVSALAQGGAQPDGQVLGWILAAQYHRVHPFTGTPPGGWAWTDRSGGVPDVDDTAGALLALSHARGEGKGEPCGRVPHLVTAVRRGLGWLLGMQNDDGGWPTFCRGWQRLPFDQSSPDLTAHALRALAAWTQADGYYVLAGTQWRDKIQAFLYWFATGGYPRWRYARDQALLYLERCQRPSGAWIPLWFGSQQTPDQSNPVLGTARVLRAYADLDLRDRPAAVQGLAFLLTAQNPDHGWGGAPGVTSTVEETALTVEALSGWYDHDAARQAYQRGAVHLAERVEAGLPLPAAPIGLYFASLWYSEFLYPLIWTVGALGRCLWVEGITERAQAGPDQFS